MAKTFDKKQWYLDNKERLQQQVINRFEHKLFNSAKASAKKKQIPFNLDVSDIIIPKNCPYLGTPLTKTQGKGKVLTNASLDRIVPELGYVKGNVQVISFLANRMKSNASIQELLTFANKVIEIHGNGID